MRLSAKSKAITLQIIKIRRRLPLRTPLRPPQRKNDDAASSLKLNTAERFKAQHSENFTGSKAAAKEAESASESGKGAKASGLQNRVIGAIKGEEPYTLTKASQYKEGSDVREMAYNLAGEDKRSEVDLERCNVLRANDRDNVIKLSQDGKGSLHVNVDGEETYFFPDEAKRLIIDGGGGSDTIVADKSVNTDLHIVGGFGEDTVDGGRAATALLPTARMRLAPVSILRKWLKSVWFLPPFMWAAAPMKATRCG